MRGQHRLSDSLFDEIYSAVANSHNWMAYPPAMFFLQKGDLHFFRTPTEARAFADGQDVRYAVTYASSVLAVYRELEGLRPTVQKINSSNNKEVMNQKNLDYLKDNLKYMGFGDKLHEQLKQELVKGSPNFQLTLETEINNKAFAVVLNFRKSDTSDMYFFNSYHATLQRKDGDVVDQAFYLKEGKGITAKEAFNLLDGRSVYKELSNKEGQSYHAWIQLDFEKRDKHNNHEVRQFHENYGYNLKAAVTKFKVTEMDGGDKEKALLTSLQKGNVQSVNIEGNGETKKLFMEANPRYKNVTIYDEGMKRVPKAELEKYQGVSNRQGFGEGHAVKRVVAGRDVGKSQTGEVSAGKGEGKEQKTEKKNC